MEMVDGYGTRENSVENSEDTDDGFSDDDRCVPSTPYQPQAQTADDFIQQLELQQKLKVINEQLRHQGDSAFSDYTARRKVTFSDHLVQYSPDDNDEDLIDASHTSVDWTQDLVDCLQDNSDNEEEAQEDMLYNGFIDELQRLQLEEVVNDDSGTEATDTVRIPDSDSLPSTTGTSSDSDSLKECDDGEDKTSILVETDGQYELVKANDVKVNGEEEPMTETMRNMVMSSQRLQSASGKRSTSLAGCRPKLPNYQGNSRSQYGVSAEQLKLKQAREKRADERKRDLEERLNEQKREKDELMNDVFKCWLRKKTEEQRSARVRKADSEPSTKEAASSSKDSEQAFKSWLRKKKEQKRHENYIERRRCQELEQAFYVPDRRTCEHAYKEWLRRKTLEKQLEEMRLTMKYKRKRKKSPLFLSLKCNNELQRTIHAYFGSTV